MTPDCMRNGWGILYEGNMILAGWFKDDNNHGNCMIICGEEWKIMKCGWCDDGDFIDVRRECT